MVEKKKEEEKMKIVTLSYDPNAESPLEYDGWCLYSFSRKHASFKDPSILETKEVKDKIRRGLAFLLSYYEHGLCQWALRGEGVKDIWDSVDVAGVLVWEQDPKNLGPKTKKAREADARRTLKVYTQWCNGEAYGYSISDTDGKELDSCWGFFDVEHMAEEVRAIVGHDAVVFEGDAKDLSDHYSFVEAQ